MTINLTKGLNLEFVKRIRHEDAHIIHQYLGPNAGYHGYDLSDWPVCDLTISTTIKPRHEPEYLK